jgi:hypothetical protein
MDIEALKEQVIPRKLLGSLHADRVCSGQRLRTEMGSASAGMSFLALAWSVNTLQERHLHTESL